MSYRPHPTTDSKPVRLLTKWQLALCLAACSSMVAAAENEPIATDRPDFVESSQVVGKGHVQIETSLNRETTRQDGVKTTLSNTPTLLRLGITEHVEARIETEGRNWLRVEQGATRQSTNGWADTSLGVKWAFKEGDEKTGQPGMALLLHADLDTGSGDFRGQGVRPSIRLVSEWEFANEVSLGIMPGLMFDKNSDGKRFTSGLLGIVLGKGFNDKLRGFVELAAQQIASSKNGGNVVSLDIGTAYLINKNTQIDAVITRGLTKNTPDFTFGVGFSIKY